MTSLSAPSFCWAFVALLGLLAVSPVGAKAGMTPEEVERFNKYTSLASAGDAEAQRELGDLYHLGIGVQRDDSIAFSWYLRSAEKGNVQAHWEVGLCYHFARGVAKDYLKAAESYRKAAELGYVSAQICLAECYKMGVGVLKDEVEALAYYSLAARTNDNARKDRDSLEREMSSSAREAGHKRAKELLKEIEAKIAAKKAGK
jgi:TPR repeat protein